MKIEESVILVTGASAGIGKATAEAFAREGANVVLTARRADRLDELVTALAHCPGQRVAVPGDIRDETFAQELAQRAITDFGRIDVLINNAGLGHRSWLTEMSPADMRDIIDTNLIGLLLLTQAAVPQMKVQGRGQIVNVSSIAGHRPLPQNALYCASKSAVNFVSRSLRMELRRENIIVTLIYPGRTLTEFGEARLGRKGTHPSKIAQVSAERVAEAIVGAVRLGRTEVYVTWYDWAFTHLNRLFPRTIDWVVEKVTGCA